MTDQELFERAADHLRARYPLPTDVDLSTRLELDRTRSRRPAVAAVAAAIAAVVVAVSVIHVVVGGGGGQGPAAGVTEPSALTGARWELRTFSGRAGHVEAATAPVIFTFGPRDAQNDGGSATQARIGTGTIVLGQWLNDLMFHSTPDLTIDQGNRVYGALTGRFAWRIDGHTLILTRQDVSFTFARVPLGARIVYINVNGRFRTDGGPSRASPQSLSGPGTVRFIDTTADRVQTTDTTRDGRYGTFVLPGHYRVIGRIDSYFNGRQDCAPVDVTVKASDSAHKVDIDCPIK